MNEIEENVLDETIIVEETSYPAVSERVKAIFLDSLVLIAMMALFTGIFSAMGEVPDQMRMVAFLIVFILYDPLLTHFYGGTLGHRMSGLRVRQSTDETKNINFFQAVIRFLIKAPLGWLSMLPMISSKKRKALHDLAVGSVVVYA